ncbi:MAG: mRNA surveillance protein pelota, partial [Candidatus Aenigmarchaeota archaeon]|nr:mRNA surveillance protein pelota [Candidatus Aenigmarchaeota archaeon]
IKRNDIIESGEKRPVTLTIAVEKVGFQKETAKLRLAGTILEGPDDVQKAGHHTMAIGTGQLLYIRKRWERHDLDRLERAKKTQPKIYLCLVDREQADYASFTASGIEMLGSMRQSRLPDKKENDPKAFYAKVIQHLASLKDFHLIVLAGPGFERENLAAFIREQDKKLAEKIILEHASYIGHAGVQEIIKKSANRMLKQTRLAEETDAVENLFKELAKEGLACYGLEPVRKACEYGAVSQLLVSEEFMQEYKDIIAKVEQARGAILFVSARHQSGEKLQGIGGIAALLRFRTDYQ